MAKKKKKKAGLKAQIFLIFGFMAAVLFSHISIILAIGMIPTLVAAIVDRTKGRIRAITVGAVNFAGCVPFIIEVWRKGGGMDDTIMLILQPKTIVIMYFSAGIGYVIDWAMTGLVSNIMVQRAKARVKEIEKKKQELVVRWGPEVTGQIPLDEYGFPRESFSPRSEGNIE